MGYSRCAVPLGCSDILAPLPQRAEFIAQTELGEPQRYAISDNRAAASSQQSGAHA